MRNPRVVPSAVSARVFLTIILLAVTLLAVAQDSTPTPGPPFGASDPLRRRSADPEGDKIREQMQREADKQWNKQRQAALKKDTDKLLEMATQLKQQVDKSNENILSLEVIKKADEIEKLAHSVREKMRARSY